jgi:catechol 2,3-dioxygenase-like lactoylglutathione lyase family enzyme
VGREKVRPEDPIMTQRRAGIAIAALLACAVLGGAAPSTHDPGDQRTMELGNFSVSLAVEDLAASRAFYETLGFKTFGGDAEQGWLILQNGTATIGLFQGMFEKNILTFNPGWNARAETLDSFTDVRELQKRLLEAGLELQVEADPGSTGPSSFMLSDPDGNTILVDQHVAKPGG